MRSFRSAGGLFTTARLDLLGQAALVGLLAGDALAALLDGHGQLLGRVEDGGQAVGAALTQAAMGQLPKILSGAIGGVGGGAILGSLLGGDPATGGALGGLLGDAIGGAGGGAILTAIVGAVMKSMNKA